MAFGTGTGLDQAKSEINVTPLIDVLLVLLIIFMIVTPLMTTALTSEIPEKAEQPLPEEYSDRQLLLSIQEDGRCWLNREEVPLPNLPTRLRQALAQRTQKILFLDGADSVPYGTVVQIMDLCVTAGAEHVAIVTESLQVPTGTGP